MPAKKVPISVTLHHIQTSIYALATIILVGWVTDALNEDLMFRIVTRYFFPQEVANYAHPFDNLTSLLIWGIPLLTGLLIMLVAALITVRHLRKKHVYTLDKARVMHDLHHIIVSPSVEQLPDVFTSYAHIGHIYFLMDPAQHEEIHNNAKMHARTAESYSLHPLHPHENMHTITLRMTRLIRTIAKNIDTEEQEIGFDVSYTSAQKSAVAMYISLEEPIMLITHHQDKIYAYATSYEVDS